MAEDKSKVSYIYTCDLCGKKVDHRDELHKDYSGAHLYICSECTELLLKDVKLDRFEEKENG